MALLKLPYELRTQIYDEVFTSWSTITISSQHIDPRQHDLSKVSFIPGLPATHVPVFEPSYQPALLDPHFPCRQAWPRNANAPTRMSLPPLLALPNTCGKIRADLEHYLRTRAARRLRFTLYLSFPYGLLVLYQMAPELLYYARKIHIVGPYVFPNPTPVYNHYNKAVCYTSPSSIALPPLREKIARLAHTALARLTRTVLGPVPHPSVTSLNLRIFYPDEDSYRQVWSDEQAPITTVLSNICGGKIDLSVARGRAGTGVSLKARSNLTGRILGNTWRNLPGGYGAVKDGAKGGAKVMEKWLLGEEEGKKGYGWRTS